MSFITQGNNSTVLTTVSYACDPQSGWTRTMNFIGPLADVKSRTVKTMADFTALGYPARASITPDQAGDRATAEVSCPDDFWNLGAKDDTVTAWSIEVAEREESLLNAPFITAGAPTFPGPALPIRAHNARMRALFKFYRDPSLSSPVRFAGDTTLWEGLAVNEDGAGTPLSFNAAIDMLQNGINKFLTFNFVLKKSGNYRHKAGQKLALENVGRHFSLAQLSDVEGFPATFIFALPQTGRWLKKGPATAIEGTRLRMETVYQHAKSFYPELYPAYEEIGGCCDAMGACVPTVFSACAAPNVWHWEGCTPGICGP